MKKTKVLEPATGPVEQTAMLGEEYQPIPLVTKMAYGFGDTACNIVFGMISTLLTLFYTDYVGISPVVIGLVMLISRIFDGVSDVIMGVIVTKTKSKWGNSRPWMLWMALPYAIAAVLLFTVPMASDTVQFLYIFVTYNLCTTVIYTAINVPYGSLSTMMTRDSHQRDLLSVFRTGMAPIGRIIAVTLTMPIVKLFGDDQAAWAKTMTIWAVLAFAMLIFCFAKCEEKVDYEAEQRANIPFKQNVKALVTNGYFWANLVLWTVTVVHATIVGTSLPYYCKYIFGNDSWMYSTLYLVETGILVVGAFLCQGLLKKYGKRDLALFGSVVAVIGQLLFLLNPHSFTWTLGTSVIRAIGEVPLTTLIFAMLGDTVEFGQWKNSIRQESLIFGGGSMGFKLGTGLTSAIVTGLLTYAGYVTSTGATVAQPQSALNMIQGIYSYGPIIVWIIAIVVLKFYKLDDIYPDIMKDLKQREAQGKM